MMYRTYLYSLAVVALLIAAVSGAGVCTGTPKMYNGKHCASTTRYWDGQMGACGCGTGNTNPFSWQWTKPTAAASAPIFGSSTWCGSGCGKCFKIAPTAVGASPVGRGAPALTSIVIKVTNLCPYGGNEQWCAAGTNSYGYDAHFDLMDYNMTGIISKMGWDNPEVTYEEVDCASNGFGDWSCQCASATSSSSSSSSSTSAPTKAASTSAPSTSTNSAPSKAATTAPTKASSTTSPTSSTVKIQINPNVNNWWFGFAVVDNTAFSKVEIMDNNGVLNSWTSMTYAGGNNWNLWSINTSGKMATPLSLRFTTSAGKVLTANGIVPSITSALIDTKLAL